MPRTAPRGGPETRNRIAEAAAPLFLERGFDDVTVAEVARAAGVSSVTVFKHFPRKEDLFFDRTTDAVELLRGAIRERHSDEDVVDGLARMLRALAGERAPLSGLADGSEHFFGTVAGSAALRSRALEIAAELGAELADELDRDARFHGDAALAAAFAMSGCAALLVGTARSLLAGETRDAVADDHNRRLERMLAGLRGAVAES